MTRRVITTTFGAGFVAIATAAIAPAAAQEAPASFAGRTIEIIVSYNPGGGYDLYSRLLAAHLGDHLPGKPNVIVRNMPGAAGLKAANHVYVVAPKDGTQIAAVDQNIPLYQLLGGKNVQFDVAKLNWIGVLASSNGIAMAWHASGVKSLDDAKRREVTMGATGANDDAHVYAKTLNAFVGTRLRLVKGYPGTSAINKAIESGEVAAMGRASYYGFAAQKPDWLAEKKVNILVQFGFARQPELPDVPLMRDLVTSEGDRQIVDLVSLPTAIGYNHWVAAEVPAGRVAALRAAYQAAVRDPKLRAQAEKQRMEIRPKTGEEVATLIKKIAATPEAVRKRAAQILEWTAN